MKMMKATDLRPGVQQVTSRTAVNVTFAQDFTVHVEWSDGQKQVLQPNAEIEVADA